jgi:hypothetical protein
MGSQPSRRKVVNSQEVVPFQTQEEGFWGTLPDELGVLILSFLAYEENSSRIGYYVSLVCNKWYTASLSIPFHKEVFGCIPPDTPVVLFSSAQLPGSFPFNKSNSPP